MVVITFLSHSRVCVSSCQTMGPWELVLPAVRPAFEDLRSREAAGQIDSSPTPLRWRSESSLEFMDHFWDLGGLGPFWDLDLDHLGFGL